MFIHGDWLKGQLDSQGATPGTDYDVVLFDGGVSPRTVLYNTDSFVLPESAANPAAAEDFISTFLDPDVQAAFAQVKGACPAVPGVDLSGFDDVARTICDGVESASNLLVEERFDTVLQDAYTGADDVDAIATALAAAYAE